MAGFVNDLPPPHSPKWRDVNGSSCALTSALILEAKSLPFAFLWKETCYWSSQMTLATWD